MNRSMFITIALTLLITGYSSVSEISVSQAESILIELKDNKLQKIIADNLKFSYRKRNPMSLPQGKVNEVTVQIRNQLGSKEFAFFTFKLDGKPYFGIVNPSKRDDGTWYYNQGADAPIMAEPLETLIMQNVPLTVGGVVNDPAIKQVKIYFDNQYSHVVDIHNKERYFLEVVKHNSPTVTKIEGLDSQQKVVYTSWDLYPKGEDKRR